MATSQKHESINGCIYYDLGEAPGDDNLTLICSNDQNDQSVFRSPNIRCSEQHTRGYTWPGTIDFKDCRLTAMPPYNFFQMFYNMHTFIISNVDLQQISAHTFKDATNVTHLIAAQNRLEEIPPLAFINAKKLRHLDFAGNAIKRIDSLAFAGLDNLTLLDLSHNYLAELNEKVLEEVPHLNFLNLSFNQISEVQSKALPLPSLLELDLANNNLTKLGDRLFHQLTNLKQLNLSFNPIGDLKRESFGFLINLEHLNMKRMNIDSIELGTFSHQHKLISLDLSENSLKMINFHLFLPNLPDLISLSLAGNQLSKLMYFRNSLFPQLLSLDIQRNDFTCSHLIHFMESVNWDKLRMPINPYVVDFSKANIRGVNCVEY